MDRTPLPSLQYTLELPEVMPPENECSLEEEQRDFGDDSVKIEKSSAKIDEL